MVRAAVLTGHGDVDVLRDADVPRPQPGAGEVLIRVEAAGLNYADVLLRRGLYPAGGTPPLVPGLEVAGTVAAAGADVGGIHVGERVAALVSGGAYAEYVVAPAELTWPVPEGVEAEAAAAVPVAGITAYNLLTLAGSLTPGETVLVHSAAGGVGTVAVQLARALGARLVFGTVGRREKVRVATDLGCDYVVDRSREDVRSAVDEATGGRGVDVILDGIAGEVFDESLSYLAEFGRLVVFGMSSGASGTAASDALYRRNRSIIGYSTTGYRIARPEVLRPVGSVVLEHVRSGRLRPLIGARYPLTRASDAHRWLEGGESIGKGVLIP